MSDSHRFMVQKSFLLNVRQACTKMTNFQLKIDFACH